MLDFSKLTDMAKIANEAKQMQERQESCQKEQTELLRNILAQLEEIKNILHSGANPK
jgi:hypothetical protein